MMRLLSALLVGLFSGFLVYMIFGLVIGSKGVSPLFVATTFLGGWALTTYVVLTGAPTAAKVWARGGLLGAGEWLMIGLAMLVYNGKTLAESEGLKASNPAGEAGATLGEGFTSMMGIGLAVSMAIPCLVIYFVANRLSNKFQPEPARIECPHCAEWISAEGKRCTFCGCTIQP